MIRIENVNKTYRKGEEPALRNFSLNISEGERLGLVGANGSGKTTLLRLLLNFIRPDSGHISILGETDLEKTRQSLGYLPERQEGLENFSPRELLQFSANMHGMSKQTAEARIETLLEFADLRQVADDLLADFSKGMCQRVHVCLALLHQPKILLLDEPMSGLDPSGQDDLRKILAQLGDITFIYASHDLEEIERFCSSVAILHKGELKHRLETRDIKQEKYIITLDAAAAPHLSEFSEFSVEISAQSTDSVIVTFVGDAGMMQAFTRWLEERHLIMRRFRSRGVLETLYQQFVKQ